MNRLSAALVVSALLEAMPPASAHGQSPQEFLDKMRSEPSQLIERALGSPNSVNNKGMFGKTALHWAAKQRRRGDVLRLLERGADPNAVDEIGASVIVEAVHGGDPEIVKYLLNKGAKVSPEGWNGMNWETILQLRLDTIGLHEKMKESGDPQFLRDAAEISVGTPEEYAQIRMLLRSHGANFAVDK